MTEDCLKGGEAKLHLNNGKWSTENVEGVTTKTVASKVKIGETQSISFLPGEPPPFYD